MREAELLRDILNEVKALRAEVKRASEYAGATRRERRRYQAAKQGPPRKREPRPPRTFRDLYPDGLPD